MVVLQALISWLGKSSGKALNAIFGWVVVALFGRTSRGEQTVLSGIVALAVLWPFLLVGLSGPRAAGFLLAFVPLSQSIPDSILRIIWLALAVAVPAAVGIAIAARARGEQHRSLPGRLLRGAPVTLALAGAFLALFVAVPLVKMASLRRRWSDEHVPLITEGDETRRAAVRIEETITRHRLGAVRARPPRWMTLPTTILRRVGGDAFEALLGSGVFFWCGEGIQIALYPSDVLVRGQKTRAAWTHGLLAEAFGRGPGLQSFDSEAQVIERQVQRVWQLLEQEPVAHHRSPVIYQRIRSMSRQLAGLDLPYDEWQVVYRRVAQLALAVDGQPQLLERAAQEEAMQEPETETAPERPLEHLSTGDLVRQLFRGTSELLKKEVELARAEVGSDVKSAVGRIVGFVIAGMCAFLGVASLCAAAILGLAQSMTPWIAAAIVGGLMFIVAGVVVAIVKARSSHAPLERTQRTLKEDARWAKERVA